MLIDDDSAHALVLEAQLAKTGLAEQVLIFHQAEQALQFESVSINGSILR